VKVKGVEEGGGGGGKRHYEGRTGNDCILWHAMQVAWSHGHQTGAESEESQR